MSDETFIDLPVQGDSKGVEKLAISLEKVIKALDKLTERLNKAIKAVNEYTNAISKEVETQEDSTNTQHDNTNATDDNTTATDKNTDATEKNTEAKQKQNGELKKAIRGFLGFAGAITGAAYALNRLTTDLAKSNQAMLNLTRQTDIALSTFQKWDGLGKLFGIENAEQQIASLNEKIFNLKLTGEGARGFQLAGIMPTNANDVLEQLRNRVSGMSDTSATYLLQQMGIDPQMLTLLRMERGEFEELGKTIEKYQLKPEQRVQIQQMNAQIQLAGQKLEYFKNILVIELMPYFVKFVQAVATITEKLSNFLIWLTKSTSAGAVATRTVLKIAGAFALWLGSIKGVALLLAKIPIIIAAITKAITFLRGALTLLSAHPIIATITAIIGAVMFLIKFLQDLADDIDHYNNGGGSLIGVIAKGLEDLDIKGFLDADVPEWLKLLIKAIDYMQNHPIAQWINAKREEHKKNRQDGGHSWGDEDNNKVSYIPNLSAANRFINTYNSNKTSSITNSPNIVQNVEITTDSPIDTMERQLRQSNAMAIRLT